VKYPEMIKTFQMTVFNRWGQRLCETSDPTKGWDGNFEGIPQPVGNYVWFIVYQDILGNSKKLSGSVLLIR
jgi:gliding motility-associated-like protein